MGSDQVDLGDLIFMASSIPIKQFLKGQAELKCTSPPVQSLCEDHSDKEVTDRTDWNTGEN